MRRYTARISFIIFVADGAPVLLDLFFFYSTLVWPGPDPALPSEPHGHILSKEPVVRVLALFLANKFGLQIEWKLAGRTSSVAENGARLCFAGDGSLIRINDFLGMLQEGNHAEDHMIQTIAVHFIGPSPPERDPAAAAHASRAPAPPLPSGEGGSSLWPH